MGGLDPHRAALELPGRLHWFQPEILPRPGGQRPAAQGLDEAALELEGLLGRAALETQVKERDGGEAIAPPGLPAEHPTGRCPAEVDPIPVLPDIAVPAVLGRVRIAVRQARLQTAGCRGEQQDKQRDTLQAGQGEKRAHRGETLSSAGRMSQKSFFLFLMPPGSFLELPGGLWFQPAPGHSGSGPFKA